MPSCRSGLNLTVAVVAALGYGSGCERASPKPAPPVPAPVHPSRDAGTPDAFVPEPVPRIVIDGPYRGPDCRTAYAPRPDRDAAPMCFEPGGAFLEGSPPGEGMEAEHPQRRVRLSPFLIDQFEVTRAQFARFLAEAKPDIPCEDLGTRLCPNNFGDTGLWALAAMQGETLLDDLNNRYTPGIPLTFRVRPGEERMPMVEVSAEDADAYCRWVGKVVPTNAQWEYAARVEPLTGKLRQFPWGDRFDPTKAYCAPTSCRNAHGRPHTGSMSVLAIALPLVDAYPGDVSPTGVRNLAGSVREWVRECASPMIPPCDDCLDPVGPTDCAKATVKEPSDVVYTPHGRTARGGSLYGDADDVRGAYRAAVGIPQGDWTDVGLRCVLDAGIVAPATTGAAPPPARR
jgi:formylglycine-generating enzyme required for sulfatase activity